MISSSKTLIWIKIFIVNDKKSTYWFTHILVGLWESVFDWQVSNMFMVLLYFIIFANLNLKFIVKKLLSKIFVFSNRITFWAMEICRMLTYAFARIAVFVCSTFSTFLNNTFNFKVCLKRYHLFLASKQLIRHWCLVVHTVEIA